VVLQVADTLPQGLFLFEILLLAARRWWRERIVS
jgi:hypothetical protein